MTKINTMTNIVRSRRRHKRIRKCDDGEEEQMMEEEEYSPLELPSCSSSSTSSSATEDSEDSEEDVIVDEDSEEDVDAVTGSSSLTVRRIPRTMDTNRSSIGDDHVVDDTMRRRRCFVKHGRTRRRMPNDDPLESSQSTKITGSHFFNFSPPSPTTVILLFLCAILQSCSAITETRCGPIDIRNKPGAFRQQWSHLGDPHAVNYYNQTVVNCTVVEGSFTISFVYNIRSTDPNAIKLKLSDYPRFPYLREITGSLLIFETTALTDLNWIFPNLRVIGGQSLIQHYSLIIYRNPDLESIGMEKLSVIRNGGVRIMDNKVLCHTKTIDWKSMIVSAVNDVVIDNAAEFAVTETGRLCQKGPCEDDKDELRCRYIEQRRGRVQSCWSNTTCQKVCKYDRLANNEIGPGCDPNGNRCHDQCIGGCDRPSDAKACSACKNLHYNGKCVEKCEKHLYILLDRRCVTEAQCLELNPVLSNKTVPIKATAGLCSDRCPLGYEVDPKDFRKCRKCDGECEIVCQLEHTIDTFPKALAIRRCNIIEGNLTIEMRGKQESGMASELKEVFSNIHTITGYLNVMRSPLFLTLSMFKNLKRIEAKSLFKEKYALSVVDNPNMRKLFDENVNFTIGRGTIQFHNNRMLCFQQIRKLLKNLGLQENPADQSNSNGDKAICEDLKIEVRVTGVTHDQIMFEWDPFNTTDIDHRKFLGYEMFYKEVDKVNKNMSIDDDRSACVDSWSSIFKQHYERDDGKAPDKISAELGSAEKIRPNTVYAFYVATQMVHHPGAKNGLSRIGFVKTKYYHPDPPILHVKAVGTNSILIYWDPPHQPNGDIARYELVFVEIDVDANVEAGKFCVDDSTKARELSIETTSSDPDKEPISYTSTLAPSLTSLIASSSKDAENGQCSAIIGCCSCSSSIESSSIPFTERPNPASAMEGAAFENDLLDAVITPSSQIRSRRSIENANRVNEMLEKQEKEEKLKTQTIIITTTGPPPIKTKTGKKPLIHIEKKQKKPKQPINTTETPSDTSDNSTELPPVVQDEPQKVATRSRKVNVTALPSGNYYELKNLKHYTSYAITISACQNTSAPEHYCSPAHKAGTKKRTKPLPDIDRVANETIDFKFVNNTQDVRITWDDVTESNGGIIGYMVKMTGLDGRTPTQKCVGAVKGWTAREIGVVFQGLADGQYQIQITAYPVSNIPGKTAISDKTITIYTPGFWTLHRMIGAAMIFLLIVLIIAAITYYYVQVHYGKKVKALSDFMHMNPEYCVDNKYTADDWELAKDDVDIGTQCGEGSFGKVFLGHGKNIESVIGCSFGPCAIKINLDDPNSSENLNYLMEANIMKNFKTNFIVKLYGVISTVQPAMVVMEVMELGNLRDYLRSKREDEVFNEMDCNFFDIIPREKFTEWAAQICDGMAYLESLKFCHRDLAARNCMINRDETVKIGDFGMARDLFYHDYYKPSGKRMMPVRWMSPESLKDGKFDSKSDIWSFGVVLYEMVTLGAQPYIGLSNDEVLNYIGMARKVIKKPECCSDYWYKIMKMCWRYAPRDRPTFLQLVHLLSAEASAEFKELSFVLNENQMALEDTEPLDLDEIELDMMDQHVDDPERRHTDSIPMKEFKANMNGVGSHSTISVDDSSQRPLISASPLQQDGPQRQGSLDEEYALMNHSRGQSDTEVRNYGGDGDYVERDVQMDVPTRRNTGASSSSYTGGPYCLTNRGGSNERAGFGEGLRLTDGIGSGHLHDDSDYVEKDISSMDTRRSTGASTSSYGIPQQTNWSGNRGATYYANRQQAAQQQAAQAQQQQQQQLHLNGGRGDRLTQLPGTGHLQNRGGPDGDYIETEPRKNNGGSPSRNGNGTSNRGSFNGRSAFGENERLIEDSEHPLA